MKTSCNPGRWLRVEGRFTLGASLEQRGSRPPGEATALDMLVFDSETGDAIALANLLRTFLADPAETVTGPIRITIEADL